MTPKDRRRGITMLLLFVVGFGWVTSDMLLSGPLVTLDHIVLALVRQHVPAEIVWVMGQYVVRPGQQAVAVPPMAVLAVVLARRRRQWRPLLVPLVVMVFLSIAVPGLKILTGRTNPDSGVDKFFAGGIEYPSGHVINTIVIWGMTFALAASLDWAVGRWLTPHRRTLLVALLTVVVGGGVVIAETHWLSDVIASLFFGVPLLWLVLHVGFTRPRRPSPDAEGGPGPATRGAVASCEHGVEEGATRG